MGNGFVPQCRHDLGKVELAERSSTAVGRHRHDQMVNPWVPAEDPVQLGPVTSINRLAARARPERGQRLQLHVPGCRLAYGGCCHQAQDGVQRRHPAGTAVRASRHRFRDPLAVDQTLAQLSDLPGWTCLSQEPDGDARFADNHGELCICIAGILACQHETPFATSTVRSWLRDPTRFPSRGQLIATTLRDAINPADPALRQTRERAFSFARITVDAALARDSEQSADTRPAAESPTVAAEFGHQLYCASGAADPEAAPGALPRRGPAPRFARLALPILADLAGIADPRLAHHIIKTLDHLRDTQPGRVLAIAATTVTSTEAYARDHIGLQDVSTLIQHVLAEYRTVIMSSAEELAAVRTMLSSFVRLGWDSAIELYEQTNYLKPL